MVSMARWPMLGQDCKIEGVARTNHAIRNLFMRTRGRCLKEIYLNLVTETLNMEASLETQMNEM